MKRNTVFWAFSFVMFSIVSACLPATFQRQADGIIISLPNGQLKLRVCSERIIRVQVTPVDTFSSRPSLMVIRDHWPCEWHVESTDNTVSLLTNRLRISVNTRTGALAFRDASGRVILQEPRENSRVMTSAEVLGEKVYHIQQNFRLTPDEAVYGLGQHQQGVMNYRGHDVTLVQENTVAVMPVLVSTNGWGLLWDNYSRTKFHDGDDGTFLWSEVADAIDYYFIYGPSFDEIMAGYRKLTGQAPLYGRWAYGYWQSKERYKTQDEIIGVVREYRRRRVPLDNIVQDWQYWGELGWGAMEFVKSRFPDPQAMIRTIHDLKAHYMISIWPTFDAKTAVYKDMAARGLLCTALDGRPKGLFDAFNPEARDLFWQYMNRNLFSIGVDAWWLDATEPEFGGKTPDEVAENIKKMGRNFLGSWARYLNAYSLMVTKGVYENQRRVTDDKRVYILTRSAYGGQQRYAATTWSGDIVATWQVLRWQISAGLNFCLSGIPYWTTDIGAFIPNNPLGCRDAAYRELYVRWFQFGAFCPIFRSHGTGTPREVWQFGDKGTWAYEALVRFDRLRYRLLPYIYSLAWRVTNEDYTIMRALPFDFAEPAIRNIDDQYMFGPAFLVNPVTEKMYFEHTYIGDVIPPDHLFTADGQPGGLTAEFYNGTNLDTLVATRVESHLNFDWNSGIRPKEVHQHYYSIRFTGELLTDEAGEYTFATTSNDGIRLWVDGRLVIDNWTDHGATVDMGKIVLQAHKRYPIKMEYYQTLGGAVTKLAWITPGRAEQTRQQEITRIKTRKVYLPECAGWYDFWTGKFYQAGQTIDAPAPINVMPLYVRAGSIVPLGPVMQYAAEKPTDPIELRVYTGADAAFTLYEDEGDNYNYEKGVYTIIPISWNESRQELTIGKRQGKFPGMLEERRFHIVWVGDGHGKGLNEGKPDKVIRYTGKQVIVKK